MPLGISSFLSIEILHSHLSWWCVCSIVNYDQTIYWVKEKYNNIYNRTMRHWAMNENIKNSSNNVHFTKTMTPYTQNRLCRAHKSHGEYAPNYAQGKKYVRIKRREKFHLNANESNNLTKYVHSHAVNKRFMTTQPTA